MGELAEAGRGAARRRTWLRWGVRLLAPLVLVVVVWRMGEPSRLFAALARASLLPLVGAAALNAAVVHLKVVRWRALLKSRGIDYGLARCWMAVLPSLYLGAITPGRVGEVLRIQYLSHDLGTPYSEGLAVTVMDRLCDLYVLSAFVAFGVAHFTTVVSGQLAWATWGAVGVATLGPLLLLVPGLAERLMGRIYRRLAKGREGGFDRFLAALRAQLGRVLVVAVPLTVIAFLINYVQGWLIGQALAVPVTFLDVMGLMAITSLLTLMPISLSGLGVRELFLSLLFPFLGWPAEEGVAFGLLLFVVIILVNMVAGFTATQIAPLPFGRRPEDGDGADRQDPDGSEDR